MDYLLLSLLLCSWRTLYASSGPPTTVSAPLANASDPDKDMYVIHAMVYQVGILTNKTDDELTNNMTGNQEAVTFYRSNGSGIDMGGIPEPLLTNITAQRVVGVAPQPDSDAMPWIKLGNTVEKPGPLGAGTESPVYSPRPARDINDDNESNSEETNDYSNNDDSPLYTLFKRAAGPPVKVSSSATVVPEEAGIKSIALPPLLGLNGNFSQIPVPIPNTAVVQYSKVNTLVHTP